MSSLEQVLPRGPRSAGLTRLENSVFPQTRSLQAPKRALQRSTALPATSASGSSGVQLEKARTRTADVSKPAELLPETLIPGGGQRPNPLLNLVLSGLSVRGPPGVPKTAEGSKTGVSKTAGAAKVSSGKGTKLSPSVSKICEPWEYVRGQWGGTGAGSGWVLRRPKTATSALKALTCHLEESDNEESDCESDDECESPPRYRGWFAARQRIPDVESDDESDDEEEESFSSQTSSLQGASFAAAGLAREKIRVVDRKGRVIWGGSDSGSESC